MKHTQIRAAIGALALTLCCAAQAQSSVQLAGQLGGGLTDYNHQGSADGNSKQLTDNLMWSSWLRFSGTEDLGDGLRAIFRLETGVNIDTGTQATPAKFWNRQSWVGLQLGQAGTVTVGRLFHAATDRAIRTFDVLQVGGSNLHVVPLALFGVNRFAGNDTRTDNAVKYRLSVPDVVEFGASVAAGEGVSGRSYSADIAHTAASYDIGATYVSFDAATQVAGSTPKHKVAGFGGNVKFGPVQPYLAYFDSSLDATVAGRPTQKNRIVDAGLSWNVVPLFTLKAAYYHDKGTSVNNVLGRDGTKETFVLVGYYNVSRRTELYATVFENRFKGGYLLDPINIAALNRAPTATSVSGVSAGIRHSF